MGDDIDRFRIGCSMAKGLHNEVGTEAQTSDSAKFILYHGTRGVLRGSNSCHGGFHNTAQEQYPQDRHRLGPPYFLSVYSLDELIGVVIQSAA